MPPEQYASLPQLLPHLPQLLGSVLRFVSQPLLSSPSQLPQPLLQEAIWHVLVEQVVVAFIREQATPQAPQFVSESRGVSQPLASMSSQFPQPGSQDAITHIEEEHTPVAWEGVHACPQRPQFMGSKRVSTHAVPQRVCPDGHWHIPPTQL
jgi:hypothetical protein